MVQPHLTYPEAIVIGLLQGVTELFPVSSLGHSVLVPAVIGGGWARDLNLTADGSPYLAFLVAVHVATAAALMVYFRRDWTRIVVGLFTSVRTRGSTTPDQRLAWLLVAATIPVGIAGLALEHALRSNLGKPVPASVFLILNGLLLAGAERLRRRAGTTTPVPVAAPTGMPQRGTAYAAQTSGGGQAVGGALAEGDATVDPAEASDRRIAAQGWAQAMFIGGAQILALLPGISRSGATMAAGLLRGLSHEDAARFAFLLATPVIAAAGLLELPELAGSAGHGILGQVLAGSVVAGIGAYLSLRFLTRYFETRTLTPFAVYCVVAGSAALAWTILT